MTSPTSGVYLQQSQPQESATLLHAHCGGCHALAQAHPVCPAALLPGWAGVAAALMAWGHQLSNLGVMPLGHCPPAFDWLHVYELVDALHHTTHSGCQATVDQRCAMTPVGSSSTSTHTVTHTAVAAGACNSCTLEVSAASMCFQAGRCNAFAAGCTQEPRTAAGACSPEACVLPQHH